MATAGGELGAARGGPNIRVERASEATAFAEAGVAGRADPAGRVDAAGWADAAGAPGTGPAGGCAGGLAAGWLNTTVELAGGAGFFGATEALFRFPVWNIIVRPAASSAAGTGAAGFATGACAGGAGGGAGLATGVGAEAPEAGAANIIVVCAADLPGGAGAGFAGMAAASAVAAERTTLNVVWHLPQRMVSPCGPIRASSTRYRAWHFSQRTSMDGSPGRLARRDL
ncbi:MAG TPA: hypothetical protein VII08_16375 [Myxococcales bacterium]